MEQRLMINSARLGHILTPGTGGPFEKAVRAGLRLASFLGFALGWEWLAYRLDSLLLPGFVETVAALGRLLATAELWEAVWISNQAMALGFLLAAAVGIGLGLLMGRSRAAERYADPYLNILLVTPKSALIPIVIMATGLGLLSRVIVTFLCAVVVITVNVRAGLRTLEPAWIEMARSFGASEGQLWRKVYLPGTFPAVLTGLRLGLARAISGMITVELLLVALGIGRLILLYRDTFDAASLYATVLIVVAEAVILLQVSRWLERWMAPWAGEGVAR
jgi:ABC-type nitrate/sulfonate/bicarbonate transport system permease component